MKSKPLNIHTIGGRGQTTLSLEGTILICRQKGWGHDFETLVPVELIRVEEEARLQGSRLIIAFVVLLAEVLLLLPLSWLYDYLALDQVSAIHNHADDLFIILFLLEFSLFFGLIVRAFKRLPTVILSIGNDDYRIDFWREKKNNSAINLFLKDLLERQEQVQETHPHPITTCIELNNIHPIVKFLGWTFLFSLPGLVTEWASLLYLALIPAAWCLDEFYQLYRQPRNFRTAVFKYRKRKWAEAADDLFLLIRQEPENIPALYFLSNLLIRLGRFDDALQVVSRLPEDYKEDQQEMGHTIWQYKRIEQRRMQVLKEKQ